MERILNILLFKFIDDTAFKPIMSLLILIAVTYTINADRKCEQSIKQSNAKIHSLINIQAQTSAIESNEQYEVLSDALKTWKHLIIDYQKQLLELSSLDAVSKIQMNLNLKHIDELFSRHLENLKANKQSSQQRFYYLQQLCTEKLDDSEHMFAEPAKQQTWKH